MMSLLPPWFFSLTSIFLSGWELASIMIHPLNKNLLCYYSIDIKTGNMQGFGIIENVVGNDVTSS